jgi:hypothetical protein
MQSSPFLRCLDDSSLIGFLSAERDAAQVLPLPALPHCTRSRGEDGREGEAQQGTRRPSGEAARHREGTERAQEGAGQATEGLLLPFVPALSRSLYAARSDSHFRLLAGIHFIQELIQFEKKIKAQETEIIQKVCPVRTKAIAASDSHVCQRPNLIKSREEIAFLQKKLADNTARMNKARI